MKSILLHILYGGIFLLMPSCLLPPFQAKLDTSLGEELVNKIQVMKTCEYRIALDKPSSRYTVTKYKDNYIGNEQAFSFPLGATLSSYLSQAQHGQKGDRIILHFNTSDFHFVLGAQFIAGVNKVRYQAHFKGPEPVRSISFPTSYFLSPFLAEKIYFPEKTFYAVAQALRSTTIQLFEEVTDRMCSSNTGMEMGRPRKVPTTEWQNYKKSGEGQSQA